MKMNSIKIEYVPIGFLRFAEYNPRKATTKQSEDLEKGIKEFGFVDPVIVNSAPNRKNIIIGGHFRVRIAKKLDMESVPVVYVNIPDIQKEKELNIRLNKNTGEFDWDLLAANFDNKDLFDWGFVPGDLGMDTEEEKKEPSMKIDTTITLKYEGERFVRILEAMEIGKREYGFETNEDLVEDLLKGIMPE